MLRAVDGLMLNLVGQSTSVGEYQGVEEGDAGVMLVVCWLGLGWLRECPQKHRCQFGFIHIVCSEWCMNFLITGTQCNSNSKPTQEKGAASIVVAALTFVCAK